MKSFFEFYEKLKNNKLNEQADAMVPPKTGMGAQAGAAMMPAPDMGATGAAGDMNLDMPPADPAADAEPAAGGDIQKQTAPAEGEIDADGIYPLLDQMLEFLNRFATEEDDEKAELKDGLTQKLEAIKNDFISLTGVEPAKKEEEAADETDEMGGAQAPETGTGIEQMTAPEAEAGGAPAGGMPGMPAAPAPGAGAAGAPAAGMGGPAMGGGGSFFGM